MCCGGNENLCNQEQPQQTLKPKKSKGGPRVTFQMIEDELEHMAHCFETKRQQRLAKIPEEIKQCVKVNLCCKPRPTCVDYFYDRFVKELKEDDKMRRKIKTQSACRMARAMAKFAPRPPLCPPSCVCTCPPQQRDVCSNTTPSACSARYQGPHQAGDPNTACRASTPDNLTSVGSSQWGTVKQKKIDPETCFGIYPCK